MKHIFVHEKDNKGPYPKGYGPFAYQVFIFDWPEFLRAQMSADLTKASSSRNETL